MFFSESDKSPQNISIILSGCGHNHCNDSINCILAPEEYKCKTLGFVLMTLLTHVTGINKVTVKANYGSNQSEEVILLQHLAGERSIVIQCTEDCVLTINLTVWSRYFHKGILIQFSGVTLVSSVISIQNIELSFSNVNFMDSVLLDQPPRSGEFGQSALWFIEVRLRSSRLHVNQTFTFHCYFVEVLATNSNLTLASSILLIELKRNNYFQSIINIFSNSSVICYLGSVFLQYNDGFLLSGGRIKLTFTNVTLENSNGIKIVKKDLGWLDSWSEVEVINSTFVNNTKSGAGGALEAIFKVSKTTKTKINHVRIVNCKFVQNKVTRSSEAYAYGGAVHVRTLLSNFGALKNLNSLKVSVVGCSFVNNAAENGGGAIFFSQFAVSATVELCEFVLSDQNLVPTKGMFISGHSNISFQECTFVNSIKRNFETLLDVQIMTHGAIKVLNINVQCLPWHRVEVSDDIASRTSEGLQRLTVRCAACSAMHYVPSNGSAKVVYKGHEGITISHGQAVCRTCPYGGQCPGDGLVARPHFWGYSSGNGTVFQQCPADYCCDGMPDNLCVAVASCAKSRAGVLCSQCKANFSQSILSNSCIPNGACTDTWFWVVFLAGAFLYMIWYTFKEDILQCPSVLSGKISQCVRGSREDKSKEQLTYIDKGYFGILIYFVQATAVLRINFHVPENRNMLRTLQQIETNVGLFLTIELSYVQADVCPATNLNQTDKVISKFLFLIGIFASWAAALLFTWWMKGFCACVFAAPKIKFDGIINKLVGGLVRITKYSYGGFTKIVFFSLLCVTVNEKTVWFHDASVLCFSTWQMLMMFFGVWYILPFPFMLYLGIFLVERKKISGNMLLAGTFFPLLFLILWSVKAFSDQSNNLVDDADSRKLKKKCWAEQEDDMKIYKRFRRGYRNSGGAQYWECVVILRRLLLNFTMLLANPTIKAGLCLTLCTVFLIHHNYKRPFIYPASNSIETLSLLLLCGEASINLVKSIHLQLGILPKSVQADMLGNLTLIETTFLPGLVVVIILLEITRSFKSRW